MKKLPIDARGYPVPWFVCWIDGKPDFRVADSSKMVKARQLGCCWVCGEKLGKWKTFVIGPMCAVNRTTSEPPCHDECAVFSATACPFLTLPRAQRRDANLPHDIKGPAGMMIERNPGVTCLWTTDRYQLFNAGNGLLYRLANPVRIEFYTERRHATRAEDGTAAVAVLEREYRAMQPLLPAA
jgi:hypothetical protein